MKKRETIGAAGYYSLEGHFIDVIIRQQMKTARKIQNMQGGHDLLRLEIPLVQLIYLTPHTRLNQ